MCPAELNTCIRARLMESGDPRGSNKGRCSKFREGSLVRQTPEGRRTYRPKRCGNNNALNDKNQQASSQKFRQLGIDCPEISTVDICESHLCSSILSRIKNIVSLCLFTNPFSRDGCGTRSVFKLSLTGSLFISTSHQIEFDTRSFWLWGFKRRGRSGTSLDSCPIGLCWS